LGGQTLRGRSTLESGDGSVMEVIQEFADVDLEHFEDHDFFV
jgi:hypothetical protein